MINVVNEDTIVEANDNYRRLDDVIDGFINNMDPKQIDKEIALFRKIAKALGVSRYNDIIVLPDDGEYSPRYIIGKYNPVNISKDAKMYNLYGIQMIEEINDNGFNYLYFKDEDDCIEYMTQIDFANNEE